MRWFLAILFCLAAAAAGADVIRVAVFDTSLSGRAPGMMLRALQKEDARQLQAVIDVIDHADADILVLGGLDWDSDLAAIGGLRDRLNDRGLGYAHLYSPPQSGGWDSGLDLDGDGITGGTGDALAWGRWAGADSLAVLSRFPIDLGATRDFGSNLWADSAPDLLPRHPDGGHWLSPRARAVLPLSGHGPFDIALTLPGAGPVRLLVAHVTPPAFDGPEQRNRLRHRAELRFLERYLRGARATDLAGRTSALSGNLLAVAGILNADPLDGQGDHDSISRLVAAGVQDPLPGSAGAVLDTAHQGGVNNSQAGDPRFDTADWPDRPGFPGNLRVDYVLPAATANVLASGVVWPTQGPLARAARAASHHRLVWADIEIFRK